MRYGSLFSGIGGFDLGFDRAGMSCSWQVEIDDYCQKVLTKHWPDVPKFKDVRHVGKHNLSAVDIIIGGFPCQPHSQAGKQKGAADDRNLWPEYRRIVSELKPAWVVGENVPGLEYTMLDTILSDLESESYEVATLNLPAIAFDAAHIRYRLFIIAYAKSERINRVTRNDSEKRTKGNKGQQKLNGNGSIVADALSESTRRRNNGTEWGERSQKESSRNGWSGRGIEDNGWPVEPDVGRVAHGIPNRVDRLTALGNAVVPQVAEFIGRQIIDAMNNRTA